MADTTYDVRDNPAETRFETEVEGLLSVLEYSKSGERIVYTHTGVPKELEGRGIAGALVKKALDQARSEGLRIVPQCSYVAAWVRRHPEYADLLHRATPPAR